MSLLDGRCPYLQHHTPDADARGRDASRNDRYNPNVPGVSRSVNSTPDDSNKRRHNVICAALWILGRVHHLVDAVEFEETRDGGEAQLSCILRKLSRKEILTDTSKFREAMENAGAYLAACDTQQYENVEPMDTVRGVLRLCADSQAILERTSKAIYFKEVECSRRECHFRNGTTKVELELRCRLPNMTAQGTIDFRGDLRTKTRCPRCEMGTLLERWSMETPPKCLVVTWGTLAGAETVSETLRVPQAECYSTHVFKFKLAAMFVSFGHRAGCMFRHENNFYFANGDSVKEVQKSDWLNARRSMAIYTFKPSLDHGGLHAMPSRSEPDGVARRTASSMSLRDPGKRRRTDGKPSRVLPNARRRASMPPPVIIDVDGGDSDSDTASGIGANHSGDRQDHGGSGMSILSASELSGRTVGDVDGGDADPSGRRRIVRLGEAAASGGATGKYCASQGMPTSPEDRQVSNAQSHHVIVDEMDVDEERQDDDVASVAGQPVDRQRNTWKRARSNLDSSKSSKRRGCGGPGVGGDDSRSFGKVGRSFSRGRSKKASTTSDTDDDVQLIPAEAPSISGRNNGVAPNDEVMPRDRALALKPTAEEETLDGVMGTPADADLDVLSKNQLSGTKDRFSRATATVAAVAVLAFGKISVAAATAAAFTSRGSPGRPSPLSESKLPDAETHQRDSKQQQKTQSTERLRSSPVPGDGGRSEEKFGEAGELEKAPEDCPRGKAALDRAVASTGGPEGRAKDVWEAPREDVYRSGREEESEKGGTLDKTEDLTQEVELLREKGKDPGRSAEDRKDERSKKGCDCCDKGGGSRGEARFTKIRGIALLDEHFCRIIDSNGWLTSQIIDIRVKQLQEAYPENLYFNSSFFGFLCPTSDKDGAFVVDYPRVRGWTKSSRLPDGKSSLFDMKKIFIPINQGNVHWVLAVVDLDARKATACEAGDAPGADEADDPEMLISFFDSLGRDGSAYVEAIQDYLVRELSSRAKMRHGKFSLKPRPPENAPQQLNSSDCGVLVLHVMQKLSTGSTEGLGRLSQEEILDLRLKLMKDIRE